MAQRPALALVLLAAPPLAAQVTPIGVRFERLDGGEIAVAIALEGEADGQTVVAVAEEWGGISGAGREIESVACSSDTGPSPRIERIGDHAWRIDHDPGQTLRLAYTLRAHDREPLPRGHNDYRNLVSDSLFHAIGQHAVVLPDDDRLEADFSLEWLGFEGRTVASSLGPGAETRRRRMSVGAFRSAFFIAGDPARLRLSTRPLRDATLGLAVVDADWGFTDERFLDLVASVVGAEREFFDDHADPWFLVALTPNGGRAGRQGFSLGGTGLTDCFALYCNTGLDLAPGGAHAGRILHLLAHEYFHTWNGHKIRIDAPEGAAYWFSEGFTDFYARRLLLRAGLWSPADWLRDLNESIAQHDRNPARGAPNARIVEAFWTDPDVSGLPYRRGDLVALLLDEEIARRSQGRESLDTVVRELHRRSMDGEPDPTPDQLFELLATHAGEETAAQVRAWVLDGVEAALPAALGGGQIVLTEGTVRVGDDGFDVGASQAAGAVAGVREGSGAHDAGLRDGQRLRSIERLPPLDGPQRLRVVTDAEEGGTRTVEFEAVSAPQRVRRYERAGDGGLSEPADPRGSSGPRRP